MNQDDNAQFDLDEMLSHLLSQQLIHRAHISSMQGLIKVLLDKVLEDRPEDGKLLYDCYLNALKDELLKNEYDNPVMQQIMKKQTKSELGDIPGIEWPT